MTNYQIKLLQLSPEWPAAIGRAMIAFGDIESEATSLIATFIGHEQARRPSMLPLKARLEYLDAVVQGVGAPTSDLEEWNRALMRVQELRANYRNRLAHGAPGQIVVATDTTITQSVEYTTARRPADRLTLEEVMPVGEMVRTASDDLTSAAGKIITWLFRDPTRMLITAPPVPPRPVCAKCGGALPETDDLPE